MDADPKTLEPDKDAPRRSMQRLVRLLLRWICRKLVKQGSLHKERIVAYYRIMREAAESEFTEDNKPTLDAFLGECHSEANAQGDSQSPAKNL